MLTYNRHNQNLHVSGYREEGTITTAFDMRVRNSIDRFHLMIKALKYIDVPAETKKKIEREMLAKLKFHEKYIREEGVDMPEIQNWRWDNIK